MKFNSPIPRTGLPTFHESSPQRSLRDGDAVPRQWQKSKDIGQQVQSNSLALEELARQVNRLRRRLSPVTEAVPGGGMNYRGQWTDTPPAPYLEFDVVLILTGTSAGTYINTVANNTNDPATGIGWVQIAPGDAFGRWS